MTMEPRDFPVAWDLAGAAYIDPRDLAEIAALAHGKTVIMATLPDRIVFYDGKTREPIAIIFNIGGRDGD